MGNSSKRPLLNPIKCLVLKVLTEISGFSSSHCDLLIKHDVLPIIKTDLDCDIEVMVEISKLIKSLCSQTLSIELYTECMKSIKLMIIFDDKDLLKPILSAYHKQIRIIPNIRMLFNQYTTEIEDKLPLKYNSDKKLINKYCDIRNNGCNQYIPSPLIDIIHSFYNIAFKKEIIINAIKINMIDRFNQIMQTINNNDVNDDTDEEIQRELMNIVWCLIDNFALDQFHTRSNIRLHCYYFLKICDCIEQNLQIFCKDICKHWAMIKFNFATLGNVEQNH